MLRILFFCLLLMGVFRVYGQTAPSVHDSIAGFRYVEITRGAVKPGASYPLLIAFHYSSGTPEEALADYDSLKTAVRIVVPVGNVRKRGGYSYYSFSHYQQDSATQMKWSRLTLDSMAAFVQAIEAKYDRKAVLSGISQGGDLAWMLAVYYPQLVKAAFPFAAFLQRQSYETILHMPRNNVPIYLYQGDADPIIALSYTRDAVKKLGGHLRLQLVTYPGLKHEINLPMKRDYSALLDKVLKK